MEKPIALALSFVNRLTPRIKLGNMIDMPRGARVTIMIQSYTLLSANTNMNLAIAYSVRPSINEPDTPSLSIMYPEIVIPYENRHKAETQNRMPPSD